MTQDGGATGVASAFAAERRKLTSQLATRVIALVCALGPLAFGLVLGEQSGLPADTLLGTWVHSSGYAVSLVVLGFGGYLGFSVLAGALAGDMFSSEDRYGTWKTVLTRSSTRRAVFAGKVLAAGAFAIALLALATVSSIVAGLIVSGSHPLVSLTGTVIGSGESLWLVLASWLVSIPPLLAFVALALLFSAATRNGIMGVLGPVLVGLVMQLLALIGSGSWVHAALVASAFDAWHGLLAAPKFYTPLLIGMGVSLVWIAASLTACWLIVRERDYAGTPVARRPGWTVAVRAVAATVVVIVALGAATSLGPASITKARLQASISPAFTRLTALQQRELGRSVPANARLPIVPTCTRRAGASEGPGDDWSCAMTVVTPTPGSAPLKFTPVVYDVSVKSNGCYKADAPPSFVGQQLMRDAHGHNVVNPLFTIYGCFDTTAGAPRAASAGPALPRKRPAPAPTAAQRAREQRSLREAEHAAGSKVVHEITEAQKRAPREAQAPEEPEIEEVLGSG